MRIFVRLLAKTCAHLCAFLKNFDVRIFVRLLAKVCAHLSSELLVTLIVTKINHVVTHHSPTYFKDFSHDDDSDSDVPLPLPDF